MSCTGINAENLSCPFQDEKGYISLANLSTASIQAILSMMSCSTVSCYAQCLLQLRAPTPIAPPICRPVISYPPSAQGVLGTQKNSLNLLTKTWVKG